MCVPKINVRASQKKSRKVKKGLKKYKKVKKSQKKNKKCERIFMKKKTNLENNLELKTSEVIFNIYKSNL